MSVYNIPERVDALSISLQNMLSISVADFRVTLVGLVMVGKNEFEYKISKNFGL